MSEEDVAKIRVANDEDFVWSKRYGFSLAEVVERYPDGCPDHVVAQVLLVTEEEVEGWYQRVVRKLRSLMRIDSL